MEQELVLLERHESVATVTLNRPEVKNAMSRALLARLGDVFREVAADHCIEVMVITGAGDAFSAGLDLKEMPDPAGIDKEAWVREMVETIRDPIDALHAFDRPVIGAINGVAITGGFELALNCDILIAAESARFMDSHTRVGIPPGWGMSQLLPRAVGVGKAKELSFTGRWFPAGEAMAWGLVVDVVPDGELLPAAKQMAAEIRTRVPAVVKHFKRVIDGGMRLPLGEAWAYELEQFEAYLKSLLA